MGAQACRCGAVTDPESHGVEDAVTDDPIWQGSLHHIETDTLTIMIHAGGLAEVDARILPPPKLQYGSPACLDVGNQVRMGDRLVRLVDAAPCSSSMQPPHAAAPCSHPMQQQRVREAKIQP